MEKMLLPSTLLRLELCCRVVTLSEQTRRSFGLKITSRLICRWKFGSKKHLFTAHQCKQWTAHTIPVWKTNEQLHQKMRYACSVSFSLKWWKVKCNPDPVVDACFTIDRRWAWHWPNVRKTVDLGVGHNEKGWKGVYSSTDTCPDRGRCFVLRL